jgi:hypothetical protein
MSESPTANHSALCPKPTVQYAERRCSKVVACEFSANMLTPRQLTHMQEWHAHRMANKGHSLNHGTRDREWHSAGYVLPKN